MKQLKPLRVGVSVTVFLLVTALFLDFDSIIAPSFTRGLLHLQFVPSLLQFSRTAALSAAGCIVILVLTMFFGRVYCSTICPLGTLQDAIGFMARRRRKPRRFQCTQPKNFLRYAILALTVLLLLTGSGLLLNLLDPFSSFGRILSNLIRPGVLALNNLAAGALEHFGLYTISRKQWAVVAPLSVGVALLTLLFVGFLAARHGRLYCNTVCPVGALLGLLSRRAFVQVRMHPASCTTCRRCEHVCKAGCIDLAEMTVDNSRCVACYNCLAVCPTGAIQLGNSWQARHGSTKTASGPDQRRRDFICHSGIYLLGLTGLVEPPKALTIQSRPTKTPEAVTCPVSPPGSISIARFTAICTACHLCVSSCPSRVLAPSFLEFGLSGIMQPRMNFHAAHCNYECTICMDICPTGALLPLTVEEKKRTQTGVAKFIKENCVVYTDNTTCGACSEHCPTKAVNMVPYANPLHKPLVIPEVNTDYCIGCGGCEHACPTRPYKAIFVDGHPEHKLAKEPVVKKIEEKADSKEAFPF